VTRTSGRPLVLALTVLLGACEESAITAPPLAAASPSLAPAHTFTNEVRVVGVVRDVSSGAPLAQAQAFAPGRTAPTATRDDGSFELVIPVPAGTAPIDVNLKARAIMYRPVAQTLRVVPGQVVTVEIEMVRDTTRLACRLVVVGAPAKPRQ
jgi:hypothetical protein